MNIKRILTASFIGIIFLVIAIAHLNITVTSRIEENTKSKEYVSKLITIQDNMSRLLVDSEFVKDNKTLEQLKSYFLTEEQKFETLKQELAQQQSDIFTFFSVELNKLFANETLIEDKFTQIYQIEVKKLQLKQKFEQYSPLEKSYRREIEKEILKTDNINVITIYSDLKYLSKEALYQYKDDEHLKQWSQQVELLKTKIDSSYLVKYMDTVQVLTETILELNKIQASENALIEETQEILMQSFNLNKKIIGEIEAQFNEFIHLKNTFLYITSAIAILSIIIIAFKVSRNVGLSVNEIQEQVDAGLKEIKNLNHEIEVTQKEVVFTMGAIGESRSKETGNHVKRVAEYSKLLALYAGLNPKEAEMLKQASPMHDIGKVAIPDSILNKPGRFDDYEREIMNTHAELGFDMLKGSKRELLNMAATVAYEHHEKWDGSGYPQGKSGEEIHIYGRITALADVFDALGSDRVYKKAWSDEKIFNLFKEERGKHFDPQLVDIFFANLDQFLAIRDTFKDE